MPVTLHTEEIPKHLFDRLDVRRLSSPGGELVTKVTAADGTVLVVPSVPLCILRDAGYVDDSPFVSVGIQGDDDGAEFIHGDWIAMMSKVNEDIGDGKDPTLLSLVDGSTLATDVSINTLEARLSRKGFKFVFVDVLSTLQPVALSPARIAMMSKVNEDIGDDKDPTLLSLVDGSTLAVGESIRTLEAQLDQIGFNFIPVDLPSTQRPVVLSAAAVVRILPDDDGTVSILLAGIPNAIVVRDPDGSVTGEVFGRQMPETGMRF